jgi:copper chaperone NosL
MRYALLLVPLLALAACKEELAQDTAPVPLTETSVGHFCQMDLLEHEGPKAQVHLEGLPAQPLYFSQVRDAIAYQRMPEQSHPILAIWVNDMAAPGATWAEPGAGNWIPAEEALFVVGGRSTGGMGAPETVPFSDPDAAADFAARNGGQVMRLAEIPDSEVLAPAALGGAPDAAGDTEFENRLRELSRKTGG